MRVSEVQELGASRSGSSLLVVSFCRDNKEELSDCGLHSQLIGNFSKSYLYGNHFSQEIEVSVVFKTWLRNVIFYTFT